MNTFGIIVPGKACITSFVPTDTTNTKFTLDLPFSFLHQPESSSSTPSSSTNDNDSTQFMSPFQISELTFFLLPNVTLPSNVGAMLYWSASIPGNPASTTTGFELLGALTPTKPTAIFQTRWRDNESLNHMIQSLTGGNSSGIMVNITITLGVSIEPLENIRNLDILSRNHSLDSKNVAKKIALDLFNFLQSFDTGQAPNGWMTVPTNIFERWFQRFERKVERDPTFFLKAQAE
jgi:protein Hikeshi